MSNSPYTILQKALLSGITFRPMNEDDFDCYAGADDDCIIGEGEEYTIIVSPHTVHTIDASGDEQLSMLEEV